MGGEVLQVPLLTFQCCMRKESISLGNIEKLEGRREGFYNKLHACTKVSDNNNNSIAKLNKQLINCNTMLKPSQDNPEIRTPL